MEREPIKDFKFAFFHKKHKCRGIKEKLRDTSREKPIGIFLRVGAPADSSVVKIGVDEGLQRRWNYRSNIYSRTENESRKKKVER